MSYREELAVIYSEEGYLTADLVVERARDSKQYPDLHHRVFGLGQKEAAEKYRLVIAHELIRKIGVKYRQENETEATIRRYHSIREESNSPVYRDIDDIQENPIHTALLLRDAERAWRDLFNRYGHLREFLEMIRGDLAA